LRDDSGSIGSFQISPEFNVDTGDLEICATTGNLLVVTSDEPRIAEFTPLRSLVAEHPLPAVALVADSQQM
jgi:hypothetical protein